jgi:hypothetical protein
VFKPVPGLTAKWMQQDIACQRAQWAVAGKDPKFAPWDPTLVDGAQIDVRDNHGHVEVLVTTDSPEAAELAVARARGTLVPGEATAVK